MSRNIIALAKWGMQKELSALWEECFGEPSRQVKFFFNNAFRPQNCLIYLAEGKLAAMVHLLPSWVLWNGRAAQEMCIRDRVWVANTGFTYYSKSDIFISLRYKYITFGGDTIEKL